MATKILSPYMNKTLRQKKVWNIKCKLTAYQTRKTDPGSGQEQPLIVFYYEVKASDGSYKKFRPDQKADAELAFENLIEFEKRQMVITV